LRDRIITYNKKMTEAPRLLRRALQPFLNLLRQGLSPNALALSLALGFMISCFPVFGATTGLCIIVALALRLNLAAMQLANYAGMPLQLLLLLPFVRLGEFIFHTESLPLSVSELRKRFEYAPIDTLHELWMWEWHAIVAWAIIAIPATLVLFFLLRFLIVRIHPSIKELALSNTRKPQQ